MVVVGDRTYAALALLGAVRAATTVVARLRLDAHRCAPAPVRLPRQTGRPRLVGARLPNLTTDANDPATPWMTHTLARWDGERDRPIELLSGTAVWYHTGLPPVAIRSRASRAHPAHRDPWGKFATQAVLCTDAAADPLQIVSWFTLRWQLEVTFREVRAHLGVETRAPMVRPRDRPHDPSPARPLLPSDPPCACPASCHRPNSSLSVVLQAPPDFR